MCGLASLTQLCHVTTHLVALLETYIGVFKLILTTIILKNDAVKLDLHLEET